MASTVEQLQESLNALADETDKGVDELLGASQSLADQAAKLLQELETSATGKDVSETFTAALDAVEDAAKQLQDAAGKARDYGEMLINS